MAVIAIDSLTALVPKDELAAPLGTDLASQSDNLLSMALRRLAGPIQQAQATVLFTRQTEKAASAVYHALAANLSRLGLKLHAGLRLELQTAGLLEHEGQIIGNQIIVHVLRNKITPCFPTLKLDIVYNHGIVKSKEVFQLGVQSGVITQQGPAYFFQGQELGAGRKQTLRFLSLDTPKCEAIDQIVRQTLLKSVRSSAAEAGTADAFQRARSRSLQNVLFFAPREADEGEIIVIALLLDAVEMVPQFAMREKEAQTPAFISLSVLIQDLFDVHGALLAQRIEAPS